MRTPYKIKALGFMLIFLCFIYSIKNGHAQGNAILSKTSNLKIPVSIDKSISGVVTDAQSNPLSGVSIVIKGTTIGTITDIDGKYSINVPEDKSVLVFSFVGYIKQEI